MRLLLSDFFCCFCFPFLNVFNRFGNRLLFEAVFVKMKKKISRIKQLKELSRSFRFERQCSSLYATYSSKGRKSIVQIHNYMFIYDPQTVLLSV